MFIKGRAVKLTNNNGSWVARVAMLPKQDGKPQVQPQLMLKTLQMQQRSPGQYAVLERIASGEYKLGFCQIKRNRNKSYILMSYSFEPQKVDDLNKNRIVGVDLGVATPAYCALNDGLQRKSFIVEGKKLLRTKRQIEARRRDIRREIDLRDIRRGHGKSSKFDPMKSLENKWDNFRKTWNHRLAKRIVEYALSQKAGIIHVEDLSPGDKPVFLGKDWPIHELLNFIEYKANEHGIEVRRVNPSKTSQTCSRCGAVKENFSFTDRARQGFPSFKCDSCGFQDNADYNAAKNIAKHINN
jgi:IS605 OrfB family transposase